MDAGGLAQMTYNDNNNFAPNNGLGLPSSGFASRGKGIHIKRLSVAPPSTINSIYEDEADAHPPRTSRSHLLAGLRTAPKPSSNVPASAPYWQTNHANHVPSTYGDRGNIRQPHDAPRTATTSHFPGASQNYLSGSGTQPIYCLPEQVLAPPDLNFGIGNDELMDPEVYNELVSQNLYLLQRQQQLQQQLMNVTAAAQQFQGLNLNGNQNGPTAPITPGTSLYNQQLQNGLQPQINPIPNQPGVYTVYNPMTGQHSVFYDQSSNGHQQFGSSPPNAGPVYPATSPDQEFPNYHRNTNMSPSHQTSHGRPTRTITPPKGTPSPPQDVKPLPAPSSNAFRPGHRKSLSNALANASLSNGTDGVRGSVPRSAGFPHTPMTGTFGPGMARAGEHPIRQPRGPPPLEELTALPTSKHEGSKNFATRQRRRAVHNLVRAGNERRSGRNGSGDTGTPSSEVELNFTVSDADSEGSSGMSGSSSTSERNAYTNATPPSANSDAPTWADLKHNQAMSSFADENGISAFQRESEKRRTPLLVLTSAAEKRKSTKF